MITGRLLGIGVGPGDPELIDPEGAALSAGGAGRGLRLGPRPAEHRPRRSPPPHLQSGQREINIALPMHPSPELADAAYDEGASRIGAELERGRDVAVLCEGDPLLYGSFNQLLDAPGAVLSGRGRARHHVDHGGRRRGAPAAGDADRHPRRRARDACRMEALRARLGQTNAAAILKLGRHLAKVRQVLGELEPARSGDLCRAGQHRASSG